MALIPTLSRNAGLSDIISRVNSLLQNRNKGDERDASLVEFGYLTTPEEVATTFKKACQWLGSQGGGRLKLPPKTLIMGPDPETAITDEEGLGLLMDDTMDNITFVGVPGSTVLKPVSNKIEMFVINGASKTKFQQIRFDNSDNGVLQNQVKGIASPGAGLAIGNACNAAIRQYTGADVTVEDCEFIEIHTALNYIGNYLDNSELDGTVTFNRNLGDGCVFGLLTMQPEHVICNGNGWVNGVDSILSTGKRDPGHLLYVSDTTGAHPYTVQSNDNYARLCADTPIKMRKGESQVCTGNVMHNVGRGITSHRSRTVTITGNTIKLANIFANDTQTSGIDITGCEKGGTVAVNTIERSGANAYGIRLRPALYEGPSDDDSEDQPGDSECALNNVRVLNNLMVDDLSGSAPKQRFIIVTGMRGGEIQGNTAQIIGDVASVGAVWGLDDCHNTNCFDNDRRALGTSSPPSGSDRLYQIDSNCTDIVVGWKRADIDVAPTGSTVNTAGARTIELRTDGEQYVAWTPTVTFATNGDFVPANVTSAGWIYKCGPRVRFGCHIKFDTNAYTTASGLLRIAFPYTANNFGADESVALGLHKNIAAAGADLSAVFGNGTTYITLRRNVQSGVGSALDIAEFPPSTADFEFAFQMSLRVVET